MGLPIAVGVLVGAVLWILWRPWGLVVFLGGTAVTFAWLLTANQTARQRMSQLGHAIKPILDERFGSEDASVAVGLLERFPLYFFFPLTSRSVSGAMSGLALASLGLAIVLALLRRWWEIPVLIPVYFISTRFAANLNPAFFMREAKTLDSVMAAQFIEGLLRFIQVDLPDLMKSRGTDPI
jgi:hypothetical protein